MSESWAIKQLLPDLQVVYKMTFSVGNVVFMIFYYGL